MLSRHEGVADYQSCETLCVTASSEDCVAYQYHADNDTCQFMTLCTGALPTPAWSQGGVPPVVTASIYHHFSWKTSERVMLILSMPRYALEHDGCSIYIHIYTYIFIKTKNPEGD